MLTVQVRSMKLPRHMGIFAAFVKAHLPATDSEKKSKDIGLLLLLKLFNVLEGTHLRTETIVSTNILLSWKRLQLIVHLLALGESTISVVGVASCVKNWWVNLRNAGKLLRA